MVSVLIAVTQAICLHVDAMKETWLTRVARKDLDEAVCCNEEVENPNVVDCRESMFRD